MRLSPRNLAVSAIAAALALAALSPVAGAAEAHHEQRGVGVGIGLGLDVDLGLGLGLDLGVGGSYSAVLTGRAEVPGPGDSDGRGYASVDVGAKRVCAAISVNRIGTATAAHIHRGAAGTSGPVVVNLKAPANGRSYGCAEVSRELAREIRMHPSRFYVNVHNAEFAAGAVRGQLRR
ncbi:CHRD domain-containing protein [Allokutzneria oryzae]|uniref:CHRD domain-containing protein n=1 Tax=Allokutzneria oryzae TaxID=1378989 RepID=A0ABV5ZPD7_9PSEU